MAEQHDATASQCLAMPKLYMSVPMLCHSTGLLFNAVAPPLATLLFNAETKRTLALPKRGQSLPCPCSALLLTAFALRRSAVRCQDPSSLFNALTSLCPSWPLGAVPRRLVTLPLLSLPSQCLHLSCPCLRSSNQRPCTANPCFTASVQCHLDTQQSLCQTVYALPLPLNSIPLRSVTLLCLLAAVHDPRISFPFNATALHRHSINQALPTQKHPCHCSATDPDRYIYRSRANP